MNEEVRIKNEETGAGRLVLAMCGGWSAARNTAVVRGHGFGATRGAGGPENGEKAPVQGVEDQGSLGLVGLCWTFQFKKFWRGGGPETGIYPTKSDQIRVFNFLTTDGHRPDDREQTQMGKS